MLATIEPKAETTMRFANGQSCLGHVILQAAPDLPGELKELQVTYDLTEIKYAGTIAQSDFEAFVHQRATGFARMDVRQNPKRRDTAAGPVIAVQKTPAAAAR